MFQLLGGFDVQNINLQPLLTQQNCDKGTHQVVVLTKSPFSQSHHGLKVSEGAEQDSEQPQWMFFFSRAEHRDRKRMDDRKFVYQWCIINVGPISVPVLINKYVKWRCSNCWNQISSTHCSHTHSLERHRPVYVMCSNSFSMSNQTMQVQRPQ